MFFCAANATPLVPASSMDIKVGIENVNMIILKMGKNRQNVRK